MKKYFLLLCIVCTYHTIFSQNSLNKGSINGNIINHNDKTPVPYASIVCKDLTKKIIGGVISDEKGDFTLSKMPLDTLNISIEFIGYETFNKQVFLNPKTKRVNLGTIVLKESNTVLDDVEIQVEESSIVQKADRKIINVGKDLVATGSNACLLYTSPSPRDA